MKTNNLKIYSTSYKNNFKLVPVFKTFPFEYRYNMRGFNAVYFEDNTKVKKRVK